MQTSDKIQVAVLCVQVAVGIVQVITTCFFIRSVGIAKHQEEDARSQISLATRQMDLMTTQYEESLRPVVSVRFHSDTGSAYQIELRNEGLGPALHLSCDPQIELNAFLIGSKGSTIAYISKDQKPQGTRLRIFSLTYQSLNSHLHTTTFCQSASGIIAVDYRDICSEADREKLKEFREGFLASANSPR